MSKYVLVVRQIHLGHIKETFKAGAVIEHDAKNNRLIIDGRTFNDARDLDILKHRSETHPDSPYVLPYSKEVAAEAKASFAPLVTSVKKQPVAQLRVIKSDADLNEEIDVRDTQISKKTAARKEEERKRVKSTKLEIVRGDQSVEERIAELKGDNSPSAIAERARIKASRPAVLPIVQDDSLGTTVGRAQISMNAGQALPDPKRVAANTAAARAQAEARKADVAKARGETAPTEAPQKRKYVRKDPNAPVVPKRKYVRRAAAPAVSSPAETVVATEG